MYWQKVSKLPPTLSLHLSLHTCVREIADIGDLSLAYTEMRLIMARVIFNFDMKLADESTDENGEWLKQNMYNLWAKGPLNV